MPTVHLPHLDEEDEPTPAPSSPPPPHRRHSWLKFLLEVVLITAGVFVGLAGESWRESREHRFEFSAWDVALATESLVHIDPELVAMIT